MAMIPEALREPLQQQHVHDNTLHKAVKVAAERAGIRQSVSAHTHCGIRSRRICWLAVHKKDREQVRSYGAGLLFATER
jgi:hypothetical protein